MAQASALHQALALAGSPLLAAAMRAQPLPDDVLCLIQIAAGDADALRRAVAATNARPDRVSAAAALYVQHVVFAPNGDHYRILAVAPEAPQAEIREHVGWLMKWLHPDRAKSEWESVFAQRVIAAWNELKTPGKRADYDRSLPGKTEARTPSGRRRAVTLTPRGAPLIARRPATLRRARVGRIAAVVVAGALAVTVLLAAGWRFPPDDDQSDPPAMAAGGGY